MLPIYRIEKREWVNDPFFIRSIERVCSVCWNSIWMYWTFPINLSFFFFYFASLSLFDAILNKQTLSVHFLWILHMLCIPKNNNNESQYISMWCTMHIAHKYCRTVTFFSLVSNFILNSFFSCSSFNLMSQAGR